MKPSVDELYAFVYRGHLARQAAGREPGSGEADAVAKRLPFELIDDTYLDPANRMAVVYAAIAGFERSARNFVKARLLDEKGETWWEDSVPAQRRKKAETRRDEENRVRWHTKRGDSLLDYTEMEDLAAIIVTNQEEFADFIPDFEWAKHIFKSVARSRNIIMHSGELEAEDIERLGMVMRDWLNQVGS